MSTPNTILIVEDEAIVAADLAAKLARLGYEVAGIAASGESAVLLAEQLRPHLVLMDIRLDGPIDGIETANAIRTRLDVPIIYLTAHSDTATLHRAKLTGPFGYILKPFDDRELETQIALGLYKHGVERQLRAQHEWLRVILSSIGDGVIAADAAGNVAFINAVAAKLTGWGKEEATGRPVQEVFRIVDARGHAVEDPVGQVLQTGSAFGPSDHALLLRRDGTKVPLADSGAPIRDDEGRILGVVLVFHDITAQMMLEEQLHQARKMELVGRLAGGVAHDFNNKLNVILGNAELALSTLGSGEPVRGFLTEISEAAQQSADLTAQLLAFARKQVIMPQLLDLNATLESMLKMLPRLIGEDIQLTWLPGANVGPIYMDPSQLDQLVTNLCANARDAIAGVGRITIETRKASRDRDPACSQAGKAAEHHVALVIGDTGCGMGPETKAHLFEPFFTTKEINKGTGLGLATVYGIVQQNHGCIDVCSEPGQGTTFTIYLPRHGEQAERTDQPEPETPIPGGSETLLVVEDDPGLLNLSQMMLERLGYRVLAAGTPEAALKLAESHAGRIDLLITDVIMPGMNGRELSQRVQSMHPDLGVVFVSGYTADIIAHQGVLEAGCLFLQKPFLIRTLALKVRAALDAGRR
jgi:hypothetical protein